MKAFHSIKWQLQIWQTLLLTGVLASLLTLHYQLHKRDLIADVDAQLQETLVVILPVVAPPMGPQTQVSPERLPLRERPQRNVEHSGINLLNNLEQYHLYALTQGSQGNKPYGNVPESLTRNPPGPVSEPRRITRDGNRELIQPHQDLQIILGRPLDDVNAKMNIVLRNLVLIGSGILLTGFIGGLLIIGKAIRPIQEISRTAEQIAAGERSRRIELSDAPEELEGMARTLNNTFDHLDEAIETQKRFSADASHELRTPISVVISQTEAALKRDRTTDEYKNTLQACLRAGKRMKNMAESLLTLTRIDSQGSALSKTRCDLNTVLSGAIDSASLLSEKHPMDFQGSEKPLFAEIDCDRIHQAVMGLLTNAIQHNPQGCAVHVALKKQSGQAVVEVYDEGSGISAEHLPHIFERFYRVDKSRSREQGGAGLGLSIVKSLIEAHSGTINAASHPGNGTTFTITLPLT